jgi:hypothetical protein
MDGWPDRLTSVGPTDNGMVPIGFSLLAAVDPSGVVTGFCFAAASTADQQLAETFFAMRAQPNLRLISVGSASSGPYIADSRASREKRTIGGGSKTTGAQHPSARRSQQLPQAKLVQAFEAMAGGNTSDRRECLRQALQRLRPLAGAASRHHRFAGTSGIEGSSAQLLDLAQ